MISIQLAQELKAAGLVWRTSVHDFFAVPERGMDDRVFVIADMMAYTELVQGWPVVAFHGTAEWALDYIFTSEVVWLPTEEQLREALLTELAAAGHVPYLSLRGGDGRFTCAVDLGEEHHFSGATASEAYAMALLHVLGLPTNEL